MARFTPIILLVALFACLVAAQVAGRGHDAIAKRKRAALDDFDNEAKRDVDLEPRSGKKQCIAWSNTFPNTLSRLASHKPFGMYTWSPWCPDNRGNITCWPMINGWPNVGKFKALGHTGIKYALGNNEPNQPGSGNMSPGSAASLWRETLSPLHSHGTKLISPAPSNAGSGVPWLKKFFEECPDCSDQCHAVGLHWYGTNATNFKQYMTNAHNALGGRKIWVTEVSCAHFGGPGGQCNSGMAWSLMEEIKAWMDETWFIETYCWFGMFHGSRAGVPSASSLLDGGGNLNALGKFYLS